MTEWFIETEMSGRFGGWTTEAGPFESRNEAEEWLVDNRSALMFPDAPTRIVKVDS